MSFIDTPEKRKRLQQALKDHQFYSGDIDGILGAQSIAAIIKARSVFQLGHQGEPVVDTNLERELGLLTIQDPAIAASGSITDLFVQMAIKAYLPQLTKGLPTMSAALAGYKTLILGVVTIIVGALSLIGWDIPGFQHVPGGLTIDAGLAMIFLRLGIKNAVTDLVEKVVSGLGK